jgi:hypothetical protein
MAPTTIQFLPRDDTGGVGTGKGDWRAHASPEDFVLEGWSEGFMVGALIIMACITIANMRRKVLLHKLILLEQLLAMSHGTFCFMSFNGYGWYLSSTAALLYCSWFIHNLVAWMKIRPFFLDRGSLFSRKTGIWTRNIYLATLVASIGPILLQIYDNFRFFNGFSDFYTDVRPYEPLFRDPWWVFTCFVLFHVVSKCYGTGVVELIKKSPRFGILMSAILLALIFTVLDIVSSIHNFLGGTDGINPWWKLSLVFKCLTDTIMLDDFKTELKRLGIKRIKKDEDRRQSYAVVLEDKDTGDQGELEFADALNVSPERFAKERYGRKSNAGPINSPNDRFRQQSVLDGNYARDQQKYGRDQTGQGGRRISHLPDLGIKKGWSALAARKTKKQIASGKYVVDVEKDADDVVRADSRQDPRQEERHMSYPMFDEDDEDSEYSDNIDPRGMERPSRPKRKAMGKLDRLTGEHFSNNDAASATARHKEHRSSSLGSDSPPESSGALNEKQEQHQSNALGHGLDGNDEMGGLDFQTKPAGF